MIGRVEYPKLKTPLSPLSRIFQAEFSTPPGGDCRAYQSPERHGDPGVGIERACARPAADEAIQRQPYRRAPDGADNGFPDRIHFSFAFRFAGDGQPRMQFRIETERPSATR